MAAQFCNDRTRYSQSEYHVTSCHPARLQNATAPSKATPAAFNQAAVFTLAKPQASPVKPGAFPLYSVSPYCSAVDSRPNRFVAGSIQCSYCGIGGHSHDMCRKKKREVGCLKCGVKGHLDHQCGKTSEKQCGYCLKIGHSEAKCFWLRKDTSQCPYCSLYGHAEHQCHRKSRDLASKTHLANPAPSASDSLRRISGPSRSSELNIESAVGSEKTPPRRSSSMRDTTAGKEQESHRVPVTQAVKAAIQLKLKAEPGRFQVLQPASRSAPVKYVRSPIDGAKPSVLVEEKSNGNTPQQPTSVDGAVHPYDGAATLPMPESDIHEATSQREKSNLKPRGGLSRSATTRCREKVANSSPTIYTFQDAIHHRRVQKPATAANHEFLEFQRKLLKERREEAIRLRREQSRVHC
ncbi:hypothetical protein VSDG_08068 [Cytospora chrysosperma]|uniref:CCHC-type domain-containing protein n=1 Tax=Cytospora chrysosperma TaxID=252740 RepID=A0A423VFD5_CYTCH|nr:hypothetical protein VSDG_08068 [Valsa sordida]